MDNLARLHQHDSILHDVATVLAVEGRDIFLRTDSGERRGVRATSCLVQPVVGDEALVTTLTDGRLFVLALLTPR